MTDRITEHDGEEHSNGYDCWCCPVYSDADGNRLTREQAEAFKRTVIITHRSERKGANDVTGDIPWML